MIACLKLPDLAPADRRLPGVLECLSAVTPYVEAEASLELRADARPRRGRYAVPHRQVDDPRAAFVYLDLGKLRAAEGMMAARVVHGLVAKEQHLPCAIGLAGGRFPARVQALSLEANLVGLVPRSQAAAFLADYPASLLPVDGETLRQLDLLGLRTLGQIAGLPGAALADRFGPAGRTMHRLASGRDTSPVARYAERQSEHLTRQFEPPVEERPPLERAIEDLIERLVPRLEEKGLLARGLALSLELAGGETRKEAVALRQPTADPDHLVQTALTLLPVRLPERVSELSLTLDDLVPVRARQLSLFEREPVEAGRLREVFRALVARYGAETFYVAELVAPDERLPERRYELRRWEDDDLPVDDRAAD